MRYQLIIDPLSIPNRLCTVPVVDLVCLTCLLQSMTKIVLDVEKESKLVKVFVRSWSWRPQKLFQEAFRRSQVLLPQSMTVSKSVFIYQFLNKAYKIQLNATGASRRHHGKQLLEKERNWKRKIQILREKCRIVYFFTKVNLLPFLERDRSLSFS